MSLRRPKATYKRRLPTSSATSANLSSPATSIVPSSSSILPQSPTLIPLTHVHHAKRPRNSVDLFIPGPEVLVTLPGCRTFTQPTGRRMDPEPSIQPATPPDCDSYNSLQTDDFGHCNSADLSLSEPEEHNLAQQDCQRRKGKRQYTRWANLITLLVPFHLRLMRETHCLRDPPQTSPPTCTCGGNVQRLAIVCISFQGTFSSRFMLSSVINISYRSGMR
jgi:hypothetical protein